MSLDNLQYNLAIALCRGSTQEAGAGGCGVQSQQDPAVGNACIYTGSEGHNYLSFPLSSPILNLHKQGHLSEDFSLCKEQIAFQKAAVILETFSHGGRMAGLIQDVKQVDRIVYFPEVLVDLLTIHLN